MPHPSTKHHQLQSDLAARGAQMMRQRHQRRLWANVAAAALALWLLASPLTFTHHDRALAWNDGVCGAVAIVLGFLSVACERGWARWANCGRGIWLLLAPLVFWAPTALAYRTGTIAGAWLFAVALLIPGMPGMRMLPGPATPPGRSGRR